MPTATAPTAAVVSGAAKGDKVAGSQPMAEKMTPKDQEICNKHNICKWHAMYGDCKFGALCRSMHLSAAERKTKELSFAVSSDKEELPTGSSENDVLVDLLNEQCNLTNAERIIPGRTAHGEAFHGQFGGLGFFALEVDTIITEETEQIVYTGEYTMRVDEIRADDMHIALDADDMHIAMDADNMRNALDADDMHIAMDADDMPIALDVVNTPIALDDEIKGVMEIPVRKNAKMDDAEAVEEYNAPEAYAERLEARGSKRKKQVRERPGGRSGQPCKNDQTLEEDATEATRSAHAEGTTPNRAFDGSRGMPYA